MFASSQEKAEREAASKRMRGWGGGKGSGSPRPSWVLCSEPPWEPPLTSLSFRFSR